MPFPAAMPFLMLLVEEAHDSPLPGAASADTVAIITVAITVAIIATIAIITAAFAAADVVLHHLHAHYVRRVRSGARLWMCRRLRMLFRKLYNLSLVKAAAGPLEAIYEVCEGILQVNEVVREATPARPSSCAASIFAGIRNRLSSAVSSKRRVAKVKRSKRAKPALYLPILETTPELCEDEGDDDELTASEEAISPSMVPREAITPPPLCVNSFVDGKQSCESCLEVKRIDDWTVAACKHGFCTDCFDMLKTSRGSQCPDCEAPIGTPKKLSFS